MKTPHLESIFDSRYSNSFFSLRFIKDEDGFVFLIDDEEYKESVRLFDGIINREYSETYILKMASVYSARAVEECANYSKKGLFDKAHRCKERLCELCDILKPSFPTVSRTVNDWACDLCLLLPKISFESEESSEYNDDSIKSRLSVTGSLMRNYVVSCFFECVLLNKRPLTTEILYPALGIFCDHEIRHELYTSSPAHYDKAYLAVIPRVLKKLFEDNPPETLFPPNKSFSARIFVGLVCPHYSGHVEGEYLPFAESPFLSEALSSAVRITDNLVRQGLSVKTRLPAGGLDSAYRKLISETVREALPDFLPPQRKVGRKPKNPEKKMSDASFDTASPKEEKPTLSLDIDFSKALRLERESWIISSMISECDDDDVTLNLGSEDEASEELIGESVTESDTQSSHTEKNGTQTEGQCVGQDAVANEEKDSVNETASNPDLPKNLPEELSDFFEGLTKNELQILRAITLSEDADALAISLGGMLLGFADSINNKALDTYGDIVIDLSSGNATLFDELEEELLRIFNSI